MSAALQRIAATTTASSPNQGPTTVGYKRDPAGRWRYESDGTLVPGAHDLTLATLWRFPRSNGYVLVAALAIEADPALAWCRDYASTDALIDHNGRTAVVRIPEADWNDEASLSLGIDAPELAPQRLLDVARLASILGTTASTVRAYTARGYLPPSTIQGLPSPLWSIPVIVRHLRTQQEKARSVPPSPARHLPKRRSRLPRKPLDLAELDNALALLDMLLVDPEIKDRYDELPEEREAYSDRYTHDR